LLGLGNLDDHFVGLGETEFVAGNRFDLVRIGLKGPYFVGQFRIFLVEAPDFVLNAFDFEFGAPHGEIPVCTENVVQEQGAYRKDENNASVLRPQGAELALLGHSGSAFQDPVGSFANQLSGSGRSFGFYVQAKQRFGTGEAEKDPRTVVERKFRPVGTVNGLYLAAKKR
jgi:hypothetical protein